jgi:hypothetical protein
LNVTGDLDPAGNQVEIQYLGDRMYRVTGLGTTVNATPLDSNNESSQDFGPVTKAITVDLKEGANVLTIKPGEGQLSFLAPQNLTVKTGSGEDIVTIETGEIRGKLSINTGGGVDTVSIDGGIVYKDVSVVTGDGDDGVAVANGIHRTKLTINTGNGDDEVGVFDATILRSINIQAGEGADIIGLKTVSSTGGTVVVNAGNNIPPEGISKEAFRDRIGVAGLIAKTVTLDGGDSSRRAKDWGQSQIGVTGTTITGNLTIKGGGARDSVGIGDDPEVQEQLEQLLPDSVELKETDVGPVAVGGTLNINTGPALDKVLLNQLTVGTFKMDTNTGDDLVQIDAGIVVTKQLTMTLGDDNDLLVLLSEEITYPLRTSINGGKGNDHLPWSGPGAVPSVFQSFENYAPL